MINEGSIIAKIAKGEYPEKEVKTSWGVFKIRYPSGVDLRNISVMKAKNLRDVPSTSFDTEFLLINDRDTSLGLLITKYPEDFPESFTGINFVNFPDQEVKNELYRSFNTFYRETQEKISAGT